MIALYIAAGIVLLAKVISFSARFCMARSFWSNENLPRYDRYFYKAAAEKYHKANQRAWGVLKDHLNPWQRLTLWATASVTVWSGGLRLRINAFQRSSACVMFLGPLPLTNVCIVEGTNNLPRGDEILAVLLAFKANRSLFFKKGVFNPPFPGMGLFG